MAILRLLRRAATAWAVALLLVEACQADDLSLSQALELAFKNNPSIAAGRLSADAARQSARGASALANPEVTVAPSVIGDAGSDSVVFFSQPLEINGSRKVRGEIARSSAEAESQGAEVVRRDVALRAKQTYWEVAEAQELVRLNQDNLKYLEALGAAVRKQFGVGSVPGSQTMKTDVELARARQELAQAELGLIHAKYALNTLLNRPVGTDLTVSEAMPATQASFDPAKLRETAFGTRPEIAAAQARADEAGGRVRAIRLAGMPDLAVQARRDSFDSDGDGGVALAITVPVVDWGSRRAERAAAETIVQSGGKVLEAERNQVALEVEQALQSVGAASRILGEYEGDILDKSEKLAGMARTGYEKGATSYLEVLEAQRTLRSIKTTYYSALANYAKALAQLEWASGFDLPAPGSPEVKK